ncbi:unnamed protein product [Citrullus colocynthis]|uniref:Uncharacterized protein n=1 Tax=Citrullus colocynthis TaxID=252529 RepID=A0ABP0YUL8_9ROSI
MASVGDSSAVWSCELVVREAHAVARGAIVCGFVRPIQLTSQWPSTTVLRFVRQLSSSLPSLEP